MIIFAYTVFGIGCAIWYGARQSFIIRAVVEGCSSWYLGCNRLTRSLAVVSDPLCGKSPSAEPLRELGELV